jgi:hypothetical protein
VVGSHAGSVYVSGLLAGLIVFGAAITAVGVPAQNQVGCALGLALITTIADSRVTDAPATGQEMPQTLVDESGPRSSG